MSRILVIEDEQLIRENLLELLEAEGFDTISAENGVDGILLAQEQIPDLIICDMRMPGLDGFEVLKMLRQEPITTGIPFIFLTAKIERSSQSQSRELGADAYVTKPFLANELIKEIMALIKK